MRCTVLIAMCALLVTSRASAQEPVPVALTYSAPSSCPTQGRFVARLRMHTQRVQLSNEPDGLTLQVAIVRTSAGYSGTLGVAQQGRPPGTRTFEAADCADVVSALALSAALSIDPEANLTVAPESSGSSGSSGSLGQTDEPTGSETTPQSETGTGSATNPSERSPSSSDGAGVSERPPPPLQPPPPQAGGGALWSIGPVLSLSFAFDPKAAIGGGLVTAVRDTSGRSVLPLELALRLEYLSTRLTRGDDPLILDWWSANLLACPLRAGEGLTVLLCGVGQAGLLLAEGVDVEQTESVSRGFFSLGLGLWARQRLSDHWELSAVADFKLPLVDRTFAVGAEGNSDLQVVSSSRPIGVSATLGAVYGF